MEQQMTDIEMLNNCINELARISVPVVLTEQIGIPVYNVRQDLIRLANSVIESTKRKEKESKEVEQINISEFPKCAEIVEGNQNE